MRRCGLRRRRWRRSVSHHRETSKKMQQNATEGVPCRNPHHCSTMPQPIASLSLDLDNKWSYLKTHGDRGWEGFPSYLDRVVPRTLDLFDELGLRITVFVVGQDAALAGNQA